MRLGFRQGAAGSFPRASVSGTEGTGEQEFEFLRVAESQSLALDRCNPMLEEAANPSWAGVGQEITRPILEAVTFKLSQEQPSAGQANMPSPATSSGGQVAKPTVSNAPWSLAPQPHARIFEPEVDAPSVSRFVNTSRGASLGSLGHLG
jgi:hypothetical protein